MTPFWTMGARNDIVLTCGLKKKKNNAVFVSTATKQRRFAGLKKLKLKCPSFSCSGRKAKIGRRKKKRGRRRRREEEVPAPGEEEEEQTCGRRWWSCTISWSTARRLALGCEPKRR